MTEFQTSHYPSCNPGCIGESHYLEPNNPPTTLDDAWVAAEAHLGDCDANELIDVLDGIIEATSRPYPKSELDSNGRIAFVHRLAKAASRS